MATKKKNTKWVVTYESDVAYVFSNKGAAIEHVMKQMEKEKTIEHMFREWDIQLIEAEEVA